MSKSLSYECLKEGKSGSLKPVCKNAREDVIGKFYQMLKEAHASLGSWSHELSDPMLLRVKSKNLRKVLVKSSLSERY